MIDASLPMWRRAFRRPFVLALLLALISVALLWGGTTLLTLGGSPYYALAGIAILTAAALTLAGRREAVAVYGLMLAGTTGWALWESGLNGWALAPRLIAPFVLGLWFLMPWVWPRLSGRPATSRLRALGGLAAATILCGAIGLLAHTTLAPRIVDPLFQAGWSHRALAAAGNGGGSGDWLNYGNDPGGSRFSPLAQINKDNVSKLAVAWTYRVGPAPAGASHSLEVTPVKVGPNLYLCTAYNDVISLDAETGRQRWRYRSNSDVRGTGYAHCRGVAYYKVPDARGICAERIITNTVDARLIALDAATGRPCEGFGTRGIVSLRTGMGDYPPGYYFPTSAPTVARGNIVLGGWVFDGMYWGEPSGVIRAFDAVTGKLSWAFDVGRPDRKGEPPAGETYTHSTPNSWAPMSADDALGLVYVPMGGAVIDLVGTARRPFDEAYSGTVVAIDAATGKERWKFQTVHHDLWDYDVASQPTLADIPIGSRIVKALIQPTKRGELFVLDRATGKPIFPVTEMPAPQTGAPAEETRISRTQPFSNALPSFRGANLMEKSMWGVTPLDQLWCRIKFREARYDGPLTLPGTRPSVMYPGFLGGMNWGGVSVDRDRNLLIVNSNHIANYNQLVPRKEAERLGIVKPMDLTKPGAENHGLAVQLGTGYASRPAPFLSILFAPCQEPPYGRLSAVDLTSGQLLWSRAIGSARDSGPLGLRSMLPFTLGAPNMGGTVTTRGGLIFMAATQDAYLRAISTATGDTLWQGRLPAGGQATPMTYMSSASGRQFVAVAAGGHGLMNTLKGDYIIAYALPGKQ